MMKILVSRKQVNCWRFDNRVMSGVTFKNALTEQLRFSCAVLAKDEGGWRPTWRESDRSQRSNNCKLNFVIQNLKMTSISFPKC